MKLKLPFILLCLFFFQIAFSQVANPASDLHFCDNDTDGDDTNGIVQNINLESQTATILGAQNPANFTVSYHSSASDAQSGTNSLVSPYTNTIRDRQTIHARAIDNGNNNFDTTTFDIVVIPVPVINAQVELKQCDDDTDGFSNFNLTEANASISNNPGIYDFSYHMSLTDAINNANPIANSTSYTNITSTNDTVWARVMDTNGNGCFKTSQINLVVSTTTIPSSFQREFQEEDDLLDISGNNNVNNDNTDGITTFDFSSVTADITSLFPVAQQLTIAYYRNQADALSESNPIADPSNYRNIGYPNSQIIYIRVDSDVDNSCLGFGPHITLTVTPSTLSLNDENKLNATVYPNPANDELLIQLLDGIPNDLTIFLYDLQGKIIQKNKIVSNGHPKVDISKVKNGVYFIKMETNEKSLIKKLIVNHN